MKQNNTVGITLMALGFFAFAATDTLAKLLTENFHPLQIVWIRTSGLFLGVCVLIAMRGTSILVTPKRGLQIVRGLLAIGSATLFIVALKFVPLVDAVAVTFIAPFIVTIFGALLLKEPVGIRRWLAVVVGFMGMLIVIRPGFAVFHPAIFLVVIAAMFFASRQLVSRWLSGIDPIVTTIAYTSIVTFLLTTLSLPFIWRTPSDVNTLLVMLALAALSAIGEVLIISALDMAQSVVLAPMHYTLILWSTLYGYFVFNELPDQWTLIGCSIIVVSGLYTLYREQRLKDNVKTS